MSYSVEELTAGVLAGRGRSIARVISWIENGEAKADAVLAALYPKTGRAWTVGLTGPPGAGKSTVVDRLVLAIRAAGRRVAVIAVDPASPFSGGAILGDRVRMTGLSADPDVYMRSMSARGQLGGLAYATAAAVDVLDAAGFDVIVVETVGVGQSEIEVAELADTTVLVQPPGLGDGVQAVKAGIMEVPAIFVVNKADLPGARVVVQDIQQALELGEWPEGTWKPPVLESRALDDADAGPGSLWAAIGAHQDHLAGAHRREAVRATRAQRLFWQAVRREAEARLRGADTAALLADITARRLHPAAAAARFLDGELGRGAR